MGMIAASFRFFCTRIGPLFILAFAVLVGWLNQAETCWEGRLFETIIPLMKGYKPPTIFGHGGMAGTIPVPDDMKPEPRPENEMFLELLGGYRMPQNGLGMCCRPSAYDHELVERTVLWYLLLGGRLIDAAHLYGNHRAIGKGIAEAIKRGVPREEIFVTTKIYPSHYGYNTTLSTVPMFTMELGLEYIDLVLMHAPVRIPFPSWKECDDLGLSKTQCRQATWKGLSELRDKGITRSIGVSNFAIHHLEQIDQLGLAPIAVNQIMYNPWAADSWSETFQYCSRNNIAVTAYNSLGGFFQHAEAKTVDTLTGLSEKHKVSVAQIMLRWALQINAAIIPGTGNPKHMRENLEIYNFELSKEDMEAIDALKTDESAKKFLKIDPLD